MRDNDHLSFFPVAYKVAGLPSLNMLSEVGFLHDRNENL